MCVCVCVCVMVVASVGDMWCSVSVCLCELCVYVCMCVRVRAHACALSVSVRACVNVCVVRPSCGGDRKQHTTRTEHPKQNPGTNNSAPLYSAIDDSVCGEGLCCYSPSRF